MLFWSVKSFDLIFWISDQMFAIYLHFLVFRNIDIRAKFSAVIKSWGTDTHSELTMRCVLSMQCMYEPSLAAQMHNSVTLIGMSTSLHISLIFEVIRVWFWDLKVCETYRTWRWNSTGDVFQPNIITLKNKTRNPFLCFLMSIPTIAMICSMS